MLTIGTNTGTNPTVAVEGFGSGISVSPGRDLEFGPVTVGSSEVLLVTLQNHRLAERVTFAPTLTGHSYTILNNAQNTCSRGIATGDVCTLPIQFSPTAVGTHNNNLTLNPSGGVPIVFPIVEVKGSGSGGCVVKDDSSPHPDC